MQRNPVALAVHDNRTKSIRPDLMLRLHHLPAVRLRRRHRRIQPSNKWNYTRTGHVTFSLIDDFSFHLMAQALLF
jgi:hypothetical protein